MESKTSIQKGEKKKHVLNWKQIIFFIQAIMLLYLFIVLLVQYRNKLGLNIPITEWKSKYITYQRDWYIDESIIETDEIIDMIYGPYVELSKGMYTIKVDYECDKNQGCLVYANSGNDRYIKTQLESLHKDQESISYSFTLTEDIDNLEVVIKYNGKGALSIKNIDIAPDIKGLLKQLLTAFYILLLFDGIVYSGITAWKSYITKTSKLRIVFCVVAIVVFLCILISAVQYIDRSDIKIPLSDWKSKYITYHIGGWYIDEDIVQTDDTIDMIYGPYIELKKGTYSIRIDYECEEDQGCLVYANSGNDAYIKTKLETLEKDKKSISYVFTLTKDIDNFETVIKYNGNGALIIKNIFIKESFSGILKKQLFILEIIFGAGVVILLCILSGKTVLFVSTFFVLFCGLIVIEEVLSDPEKSFNEEMKEIHDYPDAYDICFLGPSTMQTNISNQELYEQYGIAGISLASGSQPIYVARYILEEILQYQSPQVIFCDTSPLFYSEEENRDWTLGNWNFLLHNYLDGIKTLSVRREAFQAICNYDEGTGVRDLIAERWKTDHQNWKNIVKTKKEKADSKDHGNLIFVGVEDSFEYTFDTSDPEEKATISRNAEQYLSEMAQICKDADVELIMLTSKVNVRKAHNNIIVELSERYGVKHININEHIKETGFSFVRDLRDPSHFNLSGAIKFTDFLGEYLLQNYEIADKRNQSAYKRYEDQNKWFEEKKKIISGTPFREYLRQLASLDKKRYMIFISTEGEASVRLEDSDMELLSILGIETDLRGQNGCGYAAAIYDSVVQEESVIGGTVEIDNRTDDLTFKIISVGSSGGENAVIELNGINYMQEGNGFHFVVYDRKKGQVREAVYFDTNTERNPFGEELFKK